jgi:hypothetical protein
VFDASGHADSQREGCVARNDKDGVMLCQSFFATIFFEVEGFFFSHDESLFCSFLSNLADPLTSCNTTTTGLVATGTHIAWQTTVAQPDNGIDIVGNAGDTLTFAGKNFAAGETVHITFNDTVVATTTSTYRKCL